MLCHVYWSFLGVFGVLCLRSQRSSSCSSRTKLQPQVIADSPPCQDGGGGGAAQTFPNVFENRAKVTFSSDNHGDCNVTLSVRTPGHGDQAPRRGGHHSRSQVGGSGTRPPHPESAEVSGIKKPSPPTAAQSSASVPEKKAEDFLPVLCSGTNKDDCCESIRVCWR